MTNTTFIYIGGNSVTIDNDDVDVSYSWDEIEGQIHTGEDIIVIPEKDYSGAKKLFTVKGNYIRYRSGLGDLSQFAHWTCDKVSVSNKDCYNYSSVVTKNTRLTLYKDITDDDLVIFKGYLQSGIVSTIDYPILNSRTVELFNTEHKIDELNIIFNENSLEYINFFETVNTRKLLLSVNVKSWFKIILPYIIKNTNIKELLTCEFVSHDDTNLLASSSLEVLQVKCLGKDIIDIDKIFQYNSSMKKIILLLVKSDIPTFTKIPLVRKISASTAEYTYTR